MNSYQLGLASVFLSVLVITEAPAEDEQPHRLAIENIVVIDVTAASEREARRESQTVLIADDRILQVGSTDQITIPAGVDRINGTGKYLVPGFWNMHAHVLWPDDDVEKIVLPLMFAHGITGLRDLSSVNVPPNKTLLEIRKMSQAIADDELRGPKFMALCLRVNSSRGGPGGKAAGLQDDQQGKMAVRFANSMRLDFIKVYSGLTRPAFFGLMEMAKELDLPVAGHLPHAVTPIEASNAGLACIEHARFPALACGPDYEEWRAACARYAENESDVDPKILKLKHQRSLVANFDEHRCEEICETFARNGTHLCPTHTTRKMDAFATDPEYRADPRRKYISPSRLEDWDHDLQSTASVPPFLVTHYKEFFQLGLQVTGMAHEKGVPILAGTDTYDTNVFPGFSYHDELLHLRQAGLSPLEVLKAATIVPAQFLNQAESFGSIAVNKVADLVVLDADPLADIANTSTIDYVIFDGRAHDRHELQAVIQGVEDYVEELNARHVAGSTLQDSLYDAVLAGDVTKVLAAINDGADVNGLDAQRKTAGGNGRRSLNFAALKNDTKMIEALLTAGAGINLTNRSGYTPLHHAAEYGSTEAARMLIDKGAILTPENRRGMTPQAVAGLAGHTETARAIGEAVAEKP